MTMYNLKKALAAAAVAVFAVLAIAGCSLGPIGSPNSETPADASAEANRPEEYSLGSASGVTRLSAVRTYNPSGFMDDRRLVLTVFIEASGSQKYLKIVIENYRNYPIVGWKKYNTVAWYDNAYFELTNTTGEVVKSATSWGDPLSGSTVYWTHMPALPADAFYFKRLYIEASNRGISGKTSPAIIDYTYNP